MNKTPVKTVVAALMVSPMRNPSSSSWRQLPSPELFVPIISTNCTVIRHYPTNMPITWAA